MPIHDWSKVDANLFHDFHQAWTISIRNALNGGLLPKGYSALVDQRTAGVVPDVLAIEENANGKRGAPRGGAIVIATRPKVRHIIHAAKATLADRANRIAIHHPLGHVVCIIEIVSPGNKISRLALEKLVAKSNELLERGVHLLIVDLLPPTSRDPQGIHKAIWDEIEDNDFTLPADQNRTLAAYVAGDSAAGLVTTAYVEPVGVGEKLPDMPAYLEFDRFVYVPLEGTYKSTWKTCPEAMRAW